MTSILWLKALHLIAAVCWFAGIFYLPRIMVYYAASEHAETRRQLALMAGRLYRFITPIAVIAIVLGLALLATNPDYLQAHWLWWKLAAVLLLSAYHFYCGRLVQALRRDSDTHSAFYFRVFNEMPIALLALIVLLAVLKPF